MRLWAFSIWFLFLSSTGAAAESLVGIFLPQKLGSPLQLVAGGNFALESIDEPRLRFLSGQWKTKGKVLVLSLGDDEVAQYSIENDGRRLVLIRKTKAAMNIEYADVALATEYKKEPIKPVQRTGAGVRR